MFQCKLYNMCMIYEPQGSRVLVQDKIPDGGWEASPSLAAMWSRGRALWIR